MKLFIIFHIQQLIFRFSYWELRSSCSFCVFDLDFLIYISIHYPTISVNLIIIIIIIIIIIFIIINFFLCWNYSAS